MIPMNCALCGQEVVPALRRKYFDLATCPGCAQGQVALPLSAEGRSINVEYTPTSGVGKYKKPAVIRVQGTAQPAPGVRLSVSRRQWWTKLAELALGTLKTGDEIFDDYLWARGDGTEVMSLLRHESVRASLIECTAAGELTVSGGTVLCRREGEDLGLNDVNETTRAVLVMLHHLQTLQPTAS
jgi:hypothetical protein